MYFWCNYQFRVSRYLDLVSCDNLFTMVYANDGPIIQIGLIRALELNYIYGPQAIWM